MQFLDSVTLSGIVERDDGFLVANAFTARTGIQLYAGHEVGDRSASQVVAVYRDPSEVFSHASLRSFSHAPITIDHPTEPVTAENWKDLAVGEASAEVLREGEHLRIPLIVKDKTAIAAIKAGKRELSVGYSCDLDFTAGVAPDGQRYHARQKNIRANHIALVDHGRAGSECRIGDAWGATPLTEDHMPGPDLKTILFDGVSISITEQGEQALAKRAGDVARLTTDNLALSTKVTSLETEVGELKAKLADAEKAKPDTAALDRLASARAALIDKARAIAPDLKADGLTDAEIRLAAVTAAYGPELVKDASEAEIAGMFKTAAATQRDPVADALRARPPAGRSTSDGERSSASIAIPTSDSQLAYEARVRNGWKRKAA